MSWTSRLVAGFALALHLAAPVGAYTLTTAAPDFGDLCSVARVLSRAPAGSPSGHPVGGHLTHCQLCGGAFAAAMPAPLPPVLAANAGTFEPVPSPDSPDRPVAIAAARARGPPSLA